MIIGYSNSKRNYSNRIVALCVPRGWVVTVHSVARKLRERDDKEQAIVEYGTTYLDSELTSEYLHNK